MGRTRKSKEARTPPQVKRTSRNNRCVMTNEARYVYSDLAPNLRELIKNRKIELGQFQQRFGVHKNTIDNACADGSNPTLKTLCLLANKLDVTLDELMGKNPCKLAPDEQELLDIYRELSPNEKNSVIELLIFIHSHN